MLAICSTPKQGCSCDFIIIHAFDYDRTIYLHYDMVIMYKIVHACDGISDFLKLWLLVPYLNSTVPLATTSINIMEKNVNVKNLRSRHQDLHSQFGVPLKTAGWNCCLRLDAEKVQRKHT